MENENENKKESQNEESLEKLNKLLGLKNKTSIACPVMSKRFYAACAAMQGLCALPNKGEFENYEQAWKTLVKYSYNIADELLRQENE